MQPPPSPITPSEPTHPNRTWLIISGSLYFCTGLLAIIFPRIASIAIVEIISFLLIITGIASLCAAIFGKHDSHRSVHGMLAVLRIIIGILILKKILAGLALFTVIIAAFFIAEGILGIIAATRLRAHKYWFWLLLNGVIALALGGIILAEYPITASWIIGLLYGVNAIIAGIALLILATGGLTFPDSRQSFRL